MQTAASVLVGLAGIAAFAVLLWSSTIPHPARARAALTALLTTSFAVTVAVIAAPYIH